MAPSKKKKASAKRGKSGSVVKSSTEKRDYRKNVETLTSLAGKQESKTSDSNAFKDMLNKISVIKSRYDKVVEQMVDRSIFKTPVKTRIYSSPTSCQKRKLKLMIEFDDEEVQLTPRSSNLSSFQISTNGIRFFKPKILEPLFSEDSLLPKIFGSKKYSSLTASDFKFLVNHKLFQFNLLNEQEKAVIATSCLFLISCSKDEFLVRNAFSVLNENDYWKFSNSHFETILRNWGAPCTWEKEIVLRKEAAIKKNGPEIKDVGEGVSRMMDRASKGIELRIERNKECVSPSAINCELTFESLTHSFPYFSTNELRIVHYKGVLISMDSLLCHQSHIIFKFLSTCQNYLFDAGIKFSTLALDFAQFDLPDAVMAILMIAPKTLNGLKIASLAAAMTLSNTLHYPFDGDIVSFQYLGDLLESSGEILCNMPSKLSYKCFILVDFIISTIDPTNENVQVVQNAIRKIQEVMVTKRKSTSGEVFYYFSGLSDQLDQYLLRFASIEEEL